MQRDTIVVGASAGGVEALRSLVAGLPPNLPAAMLVVLHTPPTGVNALASILARATALKVRQAEQESPLEPGTVLVARPDHHLVVDDDGVILTRGPRENGLRPSIDVLFRSAARVLGPRVVGIVLTGALDDGSAGLAIVRGRGGVGMVQDPAEAFASGMPASAVRAAAPEYVLPLAEMPRVLTALMGAEVAGDEGGSVRYGFRAGLARPAGSLPVSSDAALEDALWMALHCLEEKASLARDLAARAARHGRPISERHFAEQAVETREAAETIRRLLVTGAGSSRSEAPSPEVRQS